MSNKTLEVMLYYSNFKILYVATSKILLEIDLPFVVDLFKSYFISL